MTAGLRKDQRKGDPSPDRPRAVGRVDWMRLLELRAEGSLDGFLLISSEDRVVSYNRRLAELFGISDNARASSTVEAFMGEVRDALVDPGRFRAMIARALARPDLVEEMALKDGRTLERRGSVLKNGRGKAAARLFFFRDVTADRQAAKELQSFVRQQAAMARLNGLALRDPSPEDLIDEAMILAAEAVQTPVDRLLERSKDGLTLNTSTAAELPREAIQFLEGVVNLVAAAVERRRSDLALRSSEAGFRALIERSPDLVAVHREGRCVYANPALLGVLGYEAPQIAGRAIAEFVHPDDRKIFRETINKGWSDGPIEIRFLRRDQGVAHVEWVALPVDYEGKPAQVGMGRDLTERRQMQARLLVADRLASVGTLAAGVAHELNNPLAYILANLSFLVRELEEMTVGKAAPSTEGETLPNGGVPHLTGLLDAVNEATEGAMRMRHIVRDLRTYSRGDEAKREPFDVLQVLDSSINLAWNDIRHRARLVRDFAPVPPVMGNASRLGQVLLNLLINAAQAVKDGCPGESEIRVATRLRHDGRVEVEVADSGCGISEEDLSRIFDPFFTTKPMGVGTGLGLWICHNLVAAQGGEIEVESRLGEGSLFRLLLPAALARETAVD